MKIPKDEENNRYSRAATAPLKKSTLAHHHVKIRSAKNTD
jgi:hypothetical protein